MTCHHTNTAHLNPPQQEPLGSEEPWPWRCAWYTADSLQECRLLFVRQLNHLWSLRPILHATAHSVTTYTPRKQTCRPIFASLTLELGSGIGSKRLSLLAPSLGAGQQQQQGVATVRQCQASYDRTTNTLDAPSQCSLWMHAMCHLDWPWQAQAVAESPAMQ